MKAVRVPAFGGPEVLAWADAEELEPEAGQVAIQVQACGLNWADLLQRQGIYPGGPRPPFLAGQEAAGTVVGQGPGVTEPTLGARVAVVASSGMHAERAVVPAASCFVLPPALSWEEGAAVPVSLLTAACALTTVGRAAPGETILIHAGGGGLGTMAIQVARRLGLRVIATASVPETRARLAALGAELVCGYDDFEVGVRRLCGARGLDLVLDGVGGDVFRRSLLLLGPFGRLVLLGLSSGEPPQIDPVKLIFGSRGVLGFHLGALLAQPALTQELAARGFSWLAEGSVRAQIGRVFPLHRIRAAHELLASRAHYGKIVLTP
jgi:NADPH2:quinone reductase